ncbi:putative protein OS=Streptomyces aurantiogriseus OX=66870 GN=GCM10010251_75090 PE=4 SV=1 [Streptomyces aurantiogriseus]|uniref:Uncharacterized protein n=1 Tax=Streptomyces aurantiogriseus TaxID=66870 RepID=A0A918KYB1_9ACTN|nr:hypothetical protein GCM10010251_75090 [Streptomyces aurantiogriseus]
MASLFSTHPQWDHASTGSRSPGPHRPGIPRVRLASRGDRWLNGPGAMACHVLPHP